MPKPVLWQRQMSLNNSHFPPLSSQFSLGLPNEHHNYSERAEQYWGNKSDGENNCCTANSQLSLSLFLITSMSEISHISLGFWQNSEAAWWSPVSSKTSHGSTIHIPPYSPRPHPKWEWYQADMCKRLFPKSCYQSQTTSPGVEEKNYHTKAVFISRASLLSDSPLGIWSSKFRKKKIIQLMKQREKQKICRHLVNTKLCQWWIPKWKPQIFAA